MKAMRCLYVVLCMLMMTIINNITHEHVAVLCQVRAGGNNTGKLIFHVHDSLKLNFNIYVTRHAKRAIKSTFSKCILIVDVSFLFR